MICDIHRLKFTAGNSSLTLGRIRAAGGGGGGGGGGGACGPPPPLRFLEFSPGR